MSGILDLETCLLNRGVFIATRIYPATSEQSAGLRSRPSAAHDPLPHHLPGKPRHQPGKDIEQDQRQHHQQEVWQRVDGDGADLLA